MQKSNRTTVKRKTIFFRLAVLAIPMVLLLLLSQTAFAQNTYVITDGDRVLVYTSSATDPAEVLDEAGLALGEDDTYTTQTGIGVSEITVQRSYTVTIKNSGEVLQVISKGETVAALLERLGIEADASSISVPLALQTYDGMQIQISRTVHSTESYTTTIPYETVYCYDATMPQGEKVVVTPGQDGQILGTANVVYVDGKETGRTVVSQTVVKQPVNEVIAIGTATELKPPKVVSTEPVIGNGTIVLPTGEVLTYTSTMQVKATAYTHTDPGCDFITSTGTTVRIGTVAVDPRVIPYGTRMYIVANDGSYVYGISTAEDCGGSIKGNRVDLYYPTHSECIQFGVRNCTIYFLG
ncbi:MAG: G5 domain-containing protein [Oscillospiraceae bacterium]|nr:G5 domain-containing protein [Oscillospiraceae bacterium]